jgi:hypothetical protein
MNKQEAMVAMVNGKKVSHPELFEGGYYFMENTQFEFVTPKGERARAQLKHDDGYYIFKKIHKKELEYFVTPSVVDQLIEGHSGPVCLVKHRSTKARVKITVILELEE